MDLDALREALEWYRERGYLAVNPPYRLDVQPIVTAARAVLDSEEALRCKTHNTESKSESRCLAWLLAFGGSDDAALTCDIEPVAVVRRRLLTEEGT